MRKVVLAAAAALALLGAVPSAQAAQFLTPSRGDNTGSVSTDSGQSLKNLYVAGANVSISNNTAGDLTVAGGMVTVNGNVEQSLGAAGGNISINGNVGSNARVAGGNVTINSVIGSDLLVAGGNVSINERASIGGDLVAGGGNVVLDAPVKGDVRVGGGSLTINSTVGGDVYVYSNRGTVTFGPRAVVKGEIVVKAANEPVVQPGAQVSAIQYTHVSPAGRSAAAALFSWWFLISLIAWFLAAWILYLLLRQRTRTIIDRNISQPWKHLGIGLLFAIIVPIAGILLFVTVIGYYLGAVVLLSYALVMAVAALFAVMHTGAITYKWLSGRAPYRLDWLTILIGVVVFRLLSWIPIIGWIFAIFMVLVSVGSLFTTLWSSRR